MTELSLRDARPLDCVVPPKTRPNWRGLLLLAFASASAVGLLAGQAAQAAQGDAGAFEPNLLLLLRFMAAIKFVGVLGVVALAAWRLTRHAPSRIAFGYIGAVALMAIAPGLIWSLAHIALAAGLFHAGLLGFLMLAWRDEDALGKSFHARNGGHRGAARRVV